MVFYGLALVGLSGFVCSEMLIQTRSEWTVEQAIFILVPLFASVTLASVTITLGLTRNGKR